MQLATKNTSNTPNQFVLFLGKAWAFINQKWLLWLFIIWLSFDISLTNGLSIKFSKPLCAKASSLFIAVKGGK
jgi:hypothetical protein